MTKNPYRSPARIIVPAVIAVGLVVSVFWFSWRNHQQRFGHASSGITNRAVNLVNRTSRSVTTSLTATNLLAPAVREFASAGSPEKERATFEQLRRQIASLPRDEASQAIRQTLDSRADAPTGLKFKLGADGSLAQAPTLRTFLLDQLAQVDPAAAAAYAEKILSSPDSPDEWAVSLRSYARARTNAEARAFLQQKFREMIQLDVWRNEPSVGFLEAFDVTVHVGGAELLPDLAALLRAKDNRAVAHAAYLALDRLIINEPAVVLGEMLNQPDAMEGREATRANFFARADAGNPQQKTLLENYLLDANLGPAELETFAGLFPNANFMISQNLLTRPVTPDRATLLQRDQAALQTVQAWQADPRFAKVQPQLGKIRKRLEMFVKQAGAVSASPSAAQP